VTDLDDLERQKEKLLESLEELDLDNRHERYVLHEMIHELEEGLHSFEERELDVHASGRNQG